MLNNICSLSMASGFSTGFFCCYKKQLHYTHSMLNLTTSTVLLYPTDTIYGLWGFITPEVVNTINQIKQRPWEKSYSIIAPSLERIPHYFAVPDPFTSERTKRMMRFPWRWLTLLLPLRNDRPRDIDFSLVSTTNIVGVRLLRHSFQQEVYALWKPLITTSANLSWHPTITHPDQLTAGQKNLIDIILDEGEIHSDPSVIIDRQTGTIIRK